MKRLISALLVISIFGSAIHLDELSKITYLIQHFKEHCKGNDDYSFYSFIKNHYITEHIAFNKKENKSHSQLPYKSNKTSKIQKDLFSTHHAFNKSLNFIPPRFNASTKSIAISSGFHNIWQPPKIG